MNVSFASTSITVREGVGIVDFALRKTEGAVGSVFVLIVTADGTATGTPIFLCKSDLVLTPD